MWYQHDQELPEESLPCHWHRATHIDVFVIFAFWLYLLYVYIYILKDSHAWQVSPQLSWRNIYQILILYGTRKYFLKFYRRGNLMNVGNSLTNTPRCQVRRSLNPSPPGVAYMYQWIEPALIQVITCHMFGIKPLREVMLTYGQSGPSEQISVKFISNYKMFIRKNAFENDGHLKWRPFCPMGNELIQLDLVIPYGVADPRPHWIR